MLSEMMSQPANNRESGEKEKIVKKFVHKIESTYICKPLRISRPTNVVIL